MNLHVVARTLLILSLFNLGACVSTKSDPDGLKAAPATPTPAPPTATSPADQMQQLSAVLSRLLPLVANPARFIDPANENAIDADTKSLKALAHATASSNRDPSYALLREHFVEDLDEAREELADRERDAARHLLRTTTSECIECHTQVAALPKFPKLDLKIDDSKLEPLERAELLAATGQYEEAIKSYRKVLTDGSLLKVSPFAWQQTARTALAIEVRAQHDPKAAASLLRDISRPKVLPKLTPDWRTALEAWKTAIKDWSNEKRLDHPAPKDWLERADHLITTANEKRAFPLSHSQDVSYFRASSLLHAYLNASGEAAATRARAMELAGEASEATRDLMVWPLHETYYEQCIRLVPHSEQAEDCFDRLHDAVTMGYSGSAGVSIPARVESRLQTYQKLASP